MRSIKDKSAKTIQAAERLWAGLFSEKNFYAFEFTRDILVENISINFYCNEVKFAVLIEDKPTREEISERNCFLKEFYRKPLQHLL